MKDLINRYVYAVTRYLPAKGREDIEQELRGLIDDLLEERCGDREPAEEDIKAALRQLGPPAELAAKYSPDRQQMLIGPSYFPYYRFVLKIVITIALAICVITGVVNMAFYAEHPVYIEIFKWIGSTLGGLITAFGAITLIFAIMQRQDVKIESWETGDFLDSLPSVPEKKERISRLDCLISIALTIVFTGVLLLVPQLFGLFYVNGQQVPLLAADVLRSRWWVIVLASLLGIVCESIKLYEGRYTLRVALVSVVTGIAGFGLAAGLMADGTIFAPQFATGLASATGWQLGQLPMLLFENLHLLILGCLALAYVLEIGGDVYKGFLYERRGRK